MAKRYVQKLYKEFALCDLSQWRTGRVGLRWRIEREVIEGKVRTKMETSMYDDVAGTQRELGCLVNRRTLSHT